MEIRTCEEFVISYLGEALEKIEKLEEENLALKTKLDEQTAPTKQISMFDTTGYYYRLDTCAYYKYNDVLKNNKKNPGWLNSVLTDDTALDEFLEMETGKDSSWWSYEVCKIHTIPYNYLFTVLTESAVVTVDMDAHEKIQMYYVDNEAYFLDKEQCSDYARQTVRKNIEYYFNRNEDDKFGEE